MVYTTVIIEKHGLLTQVFTETGDCANRFDCISDLKIAE
jgi:hypothetical protein